MIPKKVEIRLAAALKRFQPILSSAKARDINEADTVTIVKDLLAELFGYDKYSEVTAEHAIRGTYCDLAIKIDGRLEMLIEVKAIGLEPKDAHVKQAVDYAANQGCEWVVLTNGVNWRIYRVTFARPIGQELVLELNLLDLVARNSTHLAALYLLTREAIVRAALPDYHAQRQATSRFLLGAILLSDPVVEIVRRELKRISPDLRVELAEIRDALKAEVVKREVVEGEQYESARKKVAKAAGKALRARASRVVEEVTEIVMESIDSEGDDGDEDLAPTAEVEPLESSADSAEPADDEHAWPESRD